MCSMSFNGAPLPNVPEETGRNTRETQIKGKLSVCTNRTSLLYLPMLVLRDLEGDGGVEGGTERETARGSHYCLYVPAQYTGTVEGTGTSWEQGLLIYRESRSTAGSKRLHYSGYPDPRAPRIGAFGTYLERGRIGTSRPYYEQCISHCR